MLAKSYQNIICKTFLIHVVGWWNSAISLSSVVIVGGVIESNFLRSVILLIIRHCRNIHLVIDYHIHISQVPSQFTYSDTITVTSQWAQWRLKSPASRLFTRLFGRRPKKTSKHKAPRQWPCDGNSPVTDEFPAQMASNAENVSIWWRHHDVSYENYPKNITVFWKIKYFLNGETKERGYSNPTPAAVSYIFGTSSRSIANSEMDDEFWWYITNFLQFNFDFMNMIHF